jgi:hypothetical protein
VRSRFVIDKSVVFMGKLVDISFCYTYSREESKEMSLFPIIQI